MSNLKLKTTSGGSVQLTPTDTASNVVLTLPASNTTLVGADSLASPAGSSLVGYLPTGVGAVATTAQQKLRESVSVKDFGAIGDGTTDNATALAAAVAASSDLYVPSGDFLTTALANDLGSLFRGPGRILKAVSGGNQQLNSYVDKHKIVFGREYLSHFHKALIAGSNVLITCSGDSTTAGDSTSSAAYHIPNLLAEMAVNKGLRHVTAYNAGISGKSSADWISTYLATDLATNPDLYILRWGINDGALTPDQTIANIRSGLATLRAAKTLKQMSIILMMPSSVSDTPHNRDEKHFEAYRNGFAQAARDYQCCFVDTYAYLKDSRHAGDYMDSPYPIAAGAFVVGQTYEILTVGSTDFTLIGAATNTVSRIFTATGVGAGTGTATFQHIHPNDVMNLWIVSLLGEVVFPAGLSHIAVNNLVNVQGADTIKALTDATSTYPYGISLYRAPLTSGWDYDGFVLTFNHRDNIQLQFLIPYVTTTTRMAMRLGQSSAWQAWSHLGGDTPSNVTAFTNFSQDSTENMRSVRNGSICCGMGYLLGPAATLASGTQIGTLTVGIPPANAYVRLIVWNGSAYEDIRGRINYLGKIYADQNSTLNTTRVWLAGSWLNA